MNNITFESQIQQKITALSSFQKKEVLNFVEFLLIKRSPKNTSTKKLTFEWEGALKDAYGDILSVELQHKIREL